MEYRRLRLLVIVALLGGLLPPAGPATAAEERRVNLSAYRGLGTWVDIFDGRELGNPERAVERMAARGVRTLFLETSNYSRDRGILYPGAAGRFLEAAHAAGLRVVAWYLPGFDDLPRDFRRVREAIRFRSPGGERFDSFGLDIEASVVTDPATRTRRLLRLSRRIRTMVGPAYPLSAIIPSPRGMNLVPGYWPGFPYRELARIYDVIVPMGYYSYRTDGLEGARDYTRRNVRIIRRRTEKPRIPIHLIGGLSGDSSRSEVRGFVRAAREHGVLGAGLYDFATTRRGQWAELAAVPVNPRQAPPLPVRIGYSEALGNVPGEDTTHPKEVFYRTRGRAGDHVLRFEAFDVGPGEVRVLVNWRPVAEVAPTLTGQWSEPRFVPVPDSLLHEDGENVIQFVAAGNFPDWDKWGVREVTLTAA